MSLKERILFYVLVTVGCLLTLAFGLAWFSPANIPDNFSGFGDVVDVLLFASLSYVVWHQICTDILLWLIVEPIQKQPAVQPPQTGLKVAFITTFVPKSEPLEMLHDILPAMKKADYTHDVWLLDEGGSDDAKKICESYGVNYFTRFGKGHYNTDEGKFAKKTKGGNHNAWYHAHGHAYDIVAQIDTDFVPRKDFLTKTLGYFRDGKVAFVGTPQIYGNGSKSFIARGAAEQGYTFYGPILRGLHGREMTMLLGANHVIRVAALEDIGFYEAHLTEDLLTGMTLHSRKWKSLYVAEALAVGEGPTTWIAYFNQQMRWAFGGIDILLRHAPQLVRGMTKLQTRYYLMMLQHYFSGLAMMIGVGLIVLNFVFGIAAASMALSVLLLFYVPLILWQTIVAMWIQRFNIQPLEEKGVLLAGRIISIAVWPIYFLALVGVLRGKRLTFKVTPKGEGQSNLTPLSVFMPHLIIGGITLAAFIVSFFTNHQSPIIVFWAVLTIISMFGVSLGAWGNGRFSRHKPKYKTVRYRYPAKA